MSALRDLTGQRFGMLVVIRRTEDHVSSTDGRRKVQWLCQCDCGKQSSVLTESLTNRRTLSCGCMSRRMIDGGEDVALKYDLTGQTFGRLTVEGFLYYNKKNGGSIWKCKCICGKEVTARGDRLRNGETKSCGCLRSGNLKGSKNVANICIDCKKSAGLCSWSAVDRKTGELKFEPVPGWTAEKVKLRIQGDKNGNVRYADTYSIKACPLFEKDERKPGEVGDWVKLLKRGED